METTRCCGIFVHSVKNCCCDWCNSKAEQPINRQEIYAGFLSRERKNLGGGIQACDFASRLRASWIGHTKKGLLNHVHWLIKL